MRIILLLVVVLVIAYLVTRQVDEVTPVQGEGAGVIYGEELEKARDVEQLLQQEAQKRLEEADKLAR